MSMDKHDVTQLSTWLNAGWLRTIDCAFTKFLLAQVPEMNNNVQILTALVSYQLGRGEVFLNIKGLAERPLRTLALVNKQDDAIDLAADDLLLNTSVLEWEQAINSCPSIIGTGEGNTPLVYDQTLQRLYLRRYWDYQQTVNQEITRMVLAVRSSLPDDVIATIKQLFSSDTKLQSETKSLSEIDWQKIACALSLRSQFSIISGGPGTGKTTTLTKLLVVLIQLETASRRETAPIKILLAAPTGKAAARVGESIRHALARLEDDYSSDFMRRFMPSMPNKAMTLHRLLGSRPNTRAYKYNSRNKLIADIVIVDEASMIDLEMMAALLDALPKQVRLILLGDRDQLSSVEPGSVLGDLCHGAGPYALGTEAYQWVKQYAIDTTLVSPDIKAWVDNYENRSLENEIPIYSLYNQQTIVLQKSYRFKARSGIGELASAINTGNYSEVRALLTTKISSYPDLQAVTIAEENTSDIHGRLEELKKIIVEKNPKGWVGYQSYLQLINNKSDYLSLDDWAEQVLKSFNRFRVLTTLRKGFFGVEGLNQQIEHWLGSADKQDELWYQGRPVMVTRNDYGLNLMNGDIGVTLKTHEGKLRVAFPSNDPESNNKIQWVSPMRLPEVETAYAMTVHKSQGSEFEHVLLIMPDKPSQVLNKQLVYTGVTRAKETFTLIESQSEVLRQAVTSSLVMD